MSSGAQYVVAAYAVVLLALLVYLVVVAMRTGRIARETELLARLREREDATAGGEPEGQEADVGASRSLESADA
jgi:hypothetical protein